MHDAFLAPDGGKAEVFDLSTARNRHFTQQFRCAAGRSTRGRWYNSKIFWVILAMLVKWTGLLDAQGMQDGKNNIARNGGYRMNESAELHNGHDRCSASRSDEHGRDLSQTCLCHGDKNGDEYEPGSVNSLVHATISMTNNELTQDRLRNGNYGKRPLVVRRYRYKCEQPRLWRERLKSFVSHAKAVDGVYGVGPSPVEPHVNASQSLTSYNASGCKGIQKGNAISDRLHNCNNGLTNLANLTGGPGHNCGDDGAEWCDSCKRTDKMPWNVTYAPTQKMEKTEKTIGVKHGTDHKNTCDGTSNAYQCSVFCEIQNHVKKKIPFDNNFLNLYGCSCERPGTHNADQCNASENNPGNRFDFFSKHFLPGTNGRTRQQADRGPYAKGPPSCCLEKLPKQIFYEGAQVTPGFVSFNTNGE